MQARLDSATAAPEAVKAMLRAASVLLSESGLEPRQSGTGEVPSVPDQRLRLLPSTCTARTHGETEQRLWRGPGARGGKGSAHYGTGSGLPWHDRSGDAGFPRSRARLGVRRGARAFHGPGVGLNLTPWRSSPSMAGNPG